MCRLAAFPPGFTKQAAIKIMRAQLSRNTDGVGTAFLRGNEFVVNKYPGDLNKALNKSVPLFDHMPIKGWTIAHVRQATHGGNTPDNTHPFIKGNYCVAHNGMYQDHEVVRLSLAGVVKFKGQTDSETAAYLIRKLGPKAFTKLVGKGGVYLALQRDGTLHVMKTMGGVKFAEVNKNRGYVISSEFHDEWDKPSQELAYGWFHFGGDGFLDTKEESAWGSQSFRYGNRYSGWGTSPTATCPGDVSRYSKTGHGVSRSNRADSKACHGSRDDGRSSAECGTTSGITSRIIYPPYQHELGDGRFADAARLAASNSDHGKPKEAVPGEQEAAIAGKCPANEDNLPLFTDPRLWTDGDCDSLCD